MTEHTRRVRVFLSSTFRDFAEERDLLVRKVFPELRRKCRERQVELVEVDLRWGITEKEAQQGRILPICMTEIDRARPYFLGLLGERYGWIPSESEYGDALVIEELDKRLSALLSLPPGKVHGEFPTVDDVFEHVLTRVEEDIGRKTVQLAMTAIWASRSGLYEEELLAIAGIPPARWAMIRNAFDESLYENCGRICFGHDYLRKAVEDRYGLRGRKRRFLHRRMAAYFASIPMTSRVAEELPWQLERTGDTDNLAQCLMDRRMFIALQQRDEFELLGYWVRLGVNIEGAYAKAWQTWKLRGGKATGVANQLAGFLLVAGCYGAFTERLLRLCMRHHENELGPNHPDTLASMNNLANLMHKQGNDAGAEAMFRMSLKGTEKAFGREHPETLEVMNNLGVVLKGMGNESGAAEMYRRALAGSVKTFGPMHPGTLDCMNNLGNLMYLQGNLDEAKVQYQRALEGYEKGFGAEHPGTLRSLNNLAGLIFRERDFAGAEKLYRKALAGYEKTLGPEHPFTLSCIHNLGVLLDGKGDGAGAEKFYRRALEGRERALGCKHPDTLATLAALDARIAIRDSSGVDSLVKTVLSGNPKAPNLENPTFKVDGKTLTPILASLNARERRVLALRFGLGDGNALSPEEIGKALQVSQAQIRMIEAKAIRKLRHPKNVLILGAIDKNVNPS
jgi:tetratricopeptide (TPR) repeat protein